MSRPRHARVVKRCYRHNKLSYASRRDARTAIKRMDDPGMEAYRCRFEPDMWHMGHPTVNQLRWRRIDSARDLSLRCSESAVLRKNTQPLLIDPGKGRVMTHAILTHPRLPGVEVSFEEIDADTALKYLACNTPGNRTISHASLDKYMSDMVAGAWRFTGAAVLFDKSSLLIDGQHRLKAIADSAETQIMLVIRGLDAEAIRAVDTGYKRSFANILQMEKGIKDAMAVAAVITRSANWFRGNYIRGQARVADGQWTNWYPTLSQLLDHMEQREAQVPMTFQQAGLEGKRIARHQPGIIASIYGLGWMLFGEIDPYKRDEFINEFIGEPKTTALDYPINMLRETLRRRMIEASKGQPGLTELQQQHYLFKTFNSWMADDTIGTLRLPSVVRWDTLAQPTNPEA